ncbi:tRNA-modifying protein YgfZ [Vibrio sinensis]|uniref:tRNA-modifying protein YgfZ n=1 Tax=Vibrio sinensis TaxID=2302434 RepID=A0A3A6QEP5_9VIBR|nr:tRNA-modifying protein YgfZ [Vibrio sinensis]RJX70509.1 tRNA-modifying protein YgfZ [Vibrio sinensis]
MEWQNDFKPQSFTSNDSLPPLMVTALNSWGIIQANGDDKKSYLQGQVTCDVVTLEPHQVTFGSHCDAKGKVWSVFRLFHHQGGFAMLQPQSAIERELSELKKYAIFSKVDLTQSTDRLLGIMGEQAQSLIDSLSENTGDVRALEAGSAVKVGEQRWLVVLDEISAGRFIQAADAIQVDEAVWNLFEIESGSPIVEQAHQNLHIPQALNVQALNGISFKKGCYTGQETVARAKYRGMNKRALFTVQGQAPLGLVTPVELERSVGENWRSAGSMLAFFQYADGETIGQIVLPNDLDADTELRIKDQPDHKWQILTLPYSLDDED